MSSASITFISRDEIIKLAKLSSLELTEEEIGRYQQEVGTILGMIDKLKEINTEGVEPTYQVSGNTNITREDVISTDVVDVEKLLKLSPDSLDELIKVKKVL